ncbi:hypothetical protein RDI58_027000 [Solanum bulbocastanum]|uniref:Mitochondrial import inner membrane translocase subunit TIM17-2-like n=1 Tax=Solanum bulbocastanum TaxID=147425 RepID=A0AAN8SXY9_SOLBU
MIIGYYPFKFGSKSPLLLVLRFSTFFSLSASLTRSRSVGATASPSRQFIKSNQSLPLKVKAGLLCWWHTFNLYLPSQCLSPVTMGTPETSREPCPDRILDDVGGAFGMGAVGGSAFHFLKGIYHSPKGERLIGGTQAVRMNAPRIGGSFAVWGGLFSSFDCTMVYLRQKEDPWNSIIAGAATGGFLQMRQGLGAASRSALFGGVLLALIEGAGIMLNKVMSAPQNFPPMEEPLPNVPGVPGYPPGQLPGQPMGQLPGQAPVSIDGMMAESSAPSSSSSTSWFGGLFGGGKKEETATGGDDLIFRGSMFGGQYTCLSC